MLKLSGGTLAGASLLGLAGCGSSGSSGSSGGSKTLNLGSIGWTENIAVANLTKIIFEGEMNYDSVKVEGPLELGLLFQGVADEMSIVCAGVGAVVVQADPSPAEVCP